MKAKCLKKTKSRVMFSRLFLCYCGQGGASLTGLLMKPLLNTPLKAGTANMNLASVCHQTACLTVFLDIRADTVFVMNCRDCTASLCLLASSMAVGPVQALRGQWTWYSFHMALRS